MERPSSAANHSFATFARSSIVKTPHDFAADRHELFNRWRGFQPWPERLLLSMGRS